jgi:hypothetical protein
MNNAVLFVLLVIATVTPLQEMYAQRTVRMNLEQMVAEAGIIVRGTVVSVNSSVDPETGILSTFITIDVSENFFGAGDGWITLKMLASRTAGGARKFTELPGYTPGQEIIAMFHAPSEIGFTSPVGMAQGTFTVITDPRTGERNVRNGMDNARLFSGIKNSSALAKSSWLTGSTEPIEIEDFSATIRSFVTMLKK